MFRKSRKEGFSFQLNRITSLLGSMMHPKFNGWATLDFRAIELHEMNVVPILRSIVSCNIR